MWPFAQKDTYTPNKMTKKNYQTLILLTMGTLAMMLFYLTENHRALIPPIVVKFFIVINVGVTTYFSFMYFLAKDEGGSGSNRDKLRNLYGDRSYEFMSRRIGVDDFNKSAMTGVKDFARYPRSDALSMDSYSYADKILMDKTDRYNEGYGGRSRGVIDQQQGRDQSSFDSFSNGRDVYNGYQKNYDSMSFIDRDDYIRNRGARLDSDKDESKNNFGIFRNERSQNERRNPGLRGNTGFGITRDDKRSFLKSESRTNYGGFSTKMSVPSVSPFRDISHFYDKRSLKKATISKKSVISGISRNQNSFHEPDYYTNIEYVRDTLDAIKADHVKFNAWTTKHFKHWISTKLSEHILERNKKNFVKINDVLVNFGQSLYEFNQFSRIKNLKPKDRRTGLSVISVNQLLRSCINSNFRKEEWMRILGTLQESSISKVNDLASQMEEAILERYRLDLFFRIKGHNPQNVRSFILARLEDYVNWNQSNEEDQEKVFKDQPTDQEIHMSLFFNFFFENHPHYDIELDWIRLFKPPNQAFKKQDDSISHFYLRKFDYHNYKCYSKDTELQCYIGPSNVYCIMTFFLNHVKSYHHLNNDKIKNGLLRNLIGFFSIKSEDAYNGY